MTQTQRIAGGEFLIRELNWNEVFTAEQFTEEQRNILQMCHDFVQTEVLPHLDKIDKMEEGVMPAMLDKAAEIGLLGAHIPEVYGGMGVDSISSMLISEGTGHAHSVTVAMMVHNGIGSLPILYFGTDEQKAKYLPKIASGEIKGCYNLTEPNAGSDALSGKTQARLSEDGQSYIINGQKAWITNSGFADLFIVFAKTEGDKMTAFLVEKGTEGLTLGEEERKMGIKGSSTRQVFYSDVKVPVENVLGEIGKGHKIAFNILNIGRIKLGAANMGGAKKVLAYATDYAKQRVQFGVSIASFPVIQAKLADMNTRLFALESAQYRVTGDIHAMEEELRAQGKSENDALMGAAEEYAAECAMLKVYGSETLAFCADEGVQIYGGMGFSADAPMDRCYRDARINRIYEGTNEINRLLSVGMIIKRGMTGRLNLMPSIMALQGELLSAPAQGTYEGTFAAEKQAIANFKKAVLLISGAAVQKFLDKVDKEQEIMMNLAEMAMDTFLAESMLLRTEAIWQKEGEAAAQQAWAMTRLFLYDAADRIAKNGKDAIASFADGDMAKMLELGLKRYAKYSTQNCKALRRSIADKVIEANGYTR